MSDFDVVEHDLVGRVGWRRLNWIAWSAEEAAIEFDLEAGR